MTWCCNIIRWPGPVVETGRKLGAEQGMDFFSMLFAVVMPAAFGLATFIIGTPTGVLGGLAFALLAILAAFLFSRESAPQSGRLRHSRTSCMYLLDDDD